MYFLQLLPDGVYQKKFLKDVEWINNLKLRLSWGQTGNRDIGPGYAAFSRLTITNVIQDGVNYKGVYPSSLAKQRLEMGNYYRVQLRGVDFGLFKNRLSGSVELLRE